MQGLTPVQHRGRYSFKRDDLFRYEGRDGRIATGGKARTSLALMRKAVQSGAEGVVTGGSRDSIQIVIVAVIAESFNLQCRAHVPAGQETTTIRNARAAGAEVVQWRPGYNAVITKRAQDDANVRGWNLLPLGLHCVEAVQETRKQVTNVPMVKRIVVPVGSGMSLCGILCGLQDARLEIPVLGVQVGQDVRQTVQLYGPSALDSPHAPSLELVRSELPYGRPATLCSLEGLPLDPMYEAKCIPFVQDGDLLWIVGHRDPGLVTKEDRRA